VDANQIEQAKIEQAKRQVDQLAAEIARISEADLAPPEYYAKFLELMLQALQAPAGAVWIRTPQNNLMLQCQSGMREVGIDRTPQDKAMHDELLRQVALQGKPGIVAPSTSRAMEGDGQLAGNPTAYVILLAPVLYEKEVTALVEIWQDPSRPPAAHQGYLKFLLQMVGLASTFTRAHRLRQMTGQQQLWVQLEAFARQVHGSLNPTEVSYWVANEGRRLIEADRISVGLRTGSKINVYAVSGADVVEKRSNLVQRMRALFQAVVEWGERLVYTGTKDESLPPPVLEALDNYLAESNSHVLVVLPVRDERDKDTHRKPRSVLLMEAFEPKIASALLVERLEVISKHAGPALYNAVEHRRIPMRFIWGPLAYLQEGMGGQAKAITSLVITGITALLAIMLFVPYPLKMSATGQELPKDRVWVFAPRPGEIVQVKSSLLPNTVVTKDQELLVMYDTKLADEVNQLKTEIATSEARIAANIKNPDGTENKDAVLAREEARNTKAARLDQLKRMRELYNIDVVNPGYFVVKSPKTGRILNTDFQENLRGRRVQPHEPLIRIGATDAKGAKLAQWEIEVKIPQKHVGQVLKALKALEDKGEKAELDVDLLLQTQPTALYRGKLRREKIAAQANPNKDNHDEPEPVVVAWVRIDGDDIPEGYRLSPSDLVTGAEVHTRIRCGNHAMGYSLFYGVWEFTFEKVVFYLWP
jgi:hypothetical protein